ncbi:LacI family DNA-binding transcriptional regulator [Anaerocolumna xylanovorans]|uniref:Transcriptional regulator, LacI family n=1 Tax=Anaerocolumna xylanovorans DSM 12503 TaxID=1121345 RepID=A0A1M7Y2T7_9FIRM|nr:LacI family DNA-binding transcriptional regulator [Anaerocolumna xylanovorans]SHO46121.1 transcriptional regulator, LacI family [Anaerocolumna xylanovorans DSM 12503]
MNIYDISKRAGVSIATVSRVLNGNSFVSETTREKVLKVMEESDYIPNAFARGLGLDTMKTIGIMCTDSSDLFHANAINYLERELRKNGYDSLLCCTGHESANKKNYLKLLLSKRVDSIIVIGSNFLECDSKYNAYLKTAARQLPLIIINGYINAPNIYGILCDEKQAVCQAATLLLEQGKKDILFLYSNKTLSSLNKIQGYEEAYRTFGLPFKEELINQCPLTISAARDFLLSLKRDGAGFQAVMAAEDILAVGALKYARAAGLLVPDDLSVIGYNNSLLTESCDPELTSIDNHVESLCLTAVTNLMRILKKERVPATTLLSCEIIHRKTTMTESVIHENNTGGKQ